MTVQYNFCDHEIQMVSCDILGKNRLDCKDIHLLKGITRVCLYLFLFKIINEMCIIGFRILMIHYFLFVEVLVSP